MPPNQENFENFYFKPFYNKSFSDIEAERDPDANFFNEVSLQNFECSYLFPNEIKSFLSEKESSETKLSKFENLNFNPFDYGSFPDIEAERDPEKFECFLNQMESFLSEKEPM